MVFILGLSDVRLWHREKTANCTAAIRFI